MSQIEYRRLGEDLTAETKAQSHETVNKVKRYGQIRHILSLSPEGLTAKQVSVMMFTLGFSKNTDRNNAAPRLTELVRDGTVYIIGKTKCLYTGKTVAVYGLRN